MGLSPARELPIIWNIAKGSLKNKLLFLAPAMLLLGWLAPWVINPLLAFGGAFLCFEGYEKLHQMAHKYLHKGEHNETVEVEPEIITPEELEAIRTNGAIRTDFILSAEIMAISYSVVADNPFFTQAAALAFVAVGITAAVYGFVALIVKADDFGIHLAKEAQNDYIKAFGRGIITSMPTLLSALGSIGTAAMLWVGGGIIIHSIPFLHHPMEHFMHGLHLDGFMEWAVGASISLIFGIIVGFFIVLAYGKVKPLLGKIKIKR